MGVIICIILFPLFWKLCSRTFRLGGKSIDSLFDKIEKKVGCDDEDD